MIYGSDEDREWCDSGCPYEPYPFSDGHVQCRMRRADGDCVCETCDRAYWKHPFEMSILSGIDGTPFLHRLCDGSLVKL